MKITVEQVFVFEVHAAKLRPIYKPQIKQSMTKAHWTYSRQEWKTYMFKKLERKNFLLRTWKKLLLMLAFKTPEVKITPFSIAFGKDRREINQDLRVMDIELMNIDDINIMTVSFDGVKSGKKAEKLLIPVPKGKLRDAFELRQRLLAANQVFSLDQAKC